MIYWILALMVLWVCCGVLAFGLDYAYFQRKFPTLAEEHKYTDFRAALAVSILGPISLSAVLCFTRTHDKQYYGL